MPNQEMMVSTNNGDWLLVVLDSGEKVSIPEYCHVTLHKTAAGRDQFTIQEGPHAKKNASNQAGRLVPKRHAAAAQVVFYIGSEVMTWSGGPAVKGHGMGVTGGQPVFTLPTDPIPGGTWDIEVPDHPHELGKGYLNLTGHSLSWFRINSPGSRNRYIHAGTISGGCATVGIRGDKNSSAGQSALKGYEKVYAYLINRRKSPGVVGTLQVHLN